MTTGLVLLILLVVLGAFAVRRMLQMRTVKQYSPAALQERLASASPPVLLDVRTAAEHQTGHLKGSLLLPVHELRRRLGELERHRGREIVCYCQTGSRSKAAAFLLSRQGFTAGNLAGGMAEWNFVRLRRG